MLILTGGLIAMVAVMASVSSSGLLASFSQVRVREAREAAEAGLDMVIGTLNAGRNRKLLVAAVPFKGWSRSDNAGRLINPCLPDQSPSTAALGLASDQEIPIGGDRQRVFVLRTLTLRNPGRAASFVSSSEDSGPGGLAGQSEGGYSEDGIRLDAGTSSPQAGTIELVVEGRIYDNSGQLKASSRLTREYEVIPKCCGLGFSPPYGEDSRLCISPSLLIGLNGGGLLFATGSPSAPPPIPTLYQTTGPLNSSIDTSSRPAAIQCISATGVCGGSQFSLHGVPVRQLGTAAPSLPPYPNCTTVACNNGYVINTTSLAGVDYIRVTADSSGVEICNATTNSNTSANNREPAFPTGLASCTAEINNFCWRQTPASESAPVFHCRISQLTVLDDIQAGNNASVSTRKQNNTLWIDSTRGAIYLYLYSAWLVPWSLTGSPVNFTYATRSYADGQVQHLSCLDVNGAVPTTYSGICAQPARPRDLARVMVLSDANLNLTVGDDGFLRDLLLYLPRGSVSFSHPASAAAGCDPPRPGLRGILWINNLTFSRGAACTASGFIGSTSNGSMELVVPPGGSRFPTIEQQRPIIYEWVARSSTLSSLF